MLCSSKQNQNTPITTTHGPDTTSSSRFNHHGFRCSCSFGVEIALNTKADRALLDWIPVNDRLYAVPLDGFVRVSGGRLKRHCLFLVYVYVPVDCSSPEAKNEFYREFSQLFQSLHSTSAMVVAGNFNAKLGHLGEMELHVQGLFFVSADRIDNNDYPIPVCSDHRLFLKNKFCH